MNQKVIVASDSTTDLSKELAMKYGVKVLPLTVSLGDKHYRDGVDIDPEKIYAHYEKCGELPKTAAVNTLEFADFFKEVTADGSALVFFTISSDMSSTYNNACLAAKDFENVHIVDTRNLSTGGGLLVLMACDLAANGVPAAEIAERCRATAARVDASFVVDDLEFLYKGGRCSALAALGANLLQLKPCIGVADGKMGVGKKYRGKFGMTLKKYIEDQLKHIDEIEPRRIFVTHAGCDEEIVNACVEAVKAYGVFEEVLVTRAGCTISSHCGRNTLGVLFIRKEK